MDNFEYALEELNEFDNDTLKTIANDYRINIKGYKKPGIIRKISEYQDKLKNRQQKNKPIKTNIMSGQSKMTLLPPDILRLLALYFDICDILRYCMMNERFHRTICHDRIFVETLAHRYLSEHDERLQDVNQISGKFFNTDLTSAIKRGYEKRVEYLVSQAEEPEDEANFYLPSAAKYGYFDIVQYLISQGAVVSEISVDLAVRNNRFDVVKYLIEEGANLQDRHYLNALKMAAAAGNLAIVEFLLSELYYSDLDIDTARRYAIQEGHLDVVKVLSVDLDIPQLYNAIIYAIGNSRPEIADYFLQNLSDEQLNKALVSAALTAASLTSVKYLVEHTPSRPGAFSGRKGPGPRADIHTEDDILLRSYLMRYQDIKNRMTRDPKLAENSLYRNFIKYILSTDNIENFNQDLINEYKKEIDEILSKR